MGLKCLICMDCPCFSFNTCNIGNYFLNLQQISNLEQLSSSVKQRDYFMEDFVSAYLMYMKRGSELDDETCHRLVIVAHNINIR